ncbi:RNA polymerase recycling motor HelD [Bacillus sp. FJAT-49736]|uniref:RNA polymerase recycling motor HelD n=1 Tax=Bacillus sp. FJAT-49736 TaxID=2833582 RepID=UPI001BC8D5E9|nr:RNA polymerase recycling motor HelD [Bacillus sp. FJAT-49736]MBS4174966.1 UvrD-helicase domain-containing protein [Bacillus sp. FJAT-49736]
MPNTGHPDYQDELERLAFTKKYMGIVIQASESNEENFKENMKQALEGMDLKDSSFGYMSMLTNSNLLRRTADEVKRLRKFESKPYFAKINFLREETNQEEILYIGKVSLFDKETQMPIIVDWRSPVANLYYDGRLGDVSYVAEGEEYSGYLSLKRQFIIENGELEDIRDIDLTTNDELLQMSLANSSSNRLTEIVSTIQEEQNNVIRADLNKPIIVQGAAGSGKTTIALHRLSYFIYTYADHFTPNQLMILAPNRLFIDYISEVLPELGVENIHQTTFVDYVLKCIGKKIKLTHPDEKLLKIMNREIQKPELTRWLSAFKGSLQFRDIIDRYLQDILKTLVPQEDFYVSKFRLYSAKKIRKLMTYEYEYLPYYQRVEKIKRVLQNHVRTEKKTMIERITNFYDNKLEKALYSKADPNTRRKYVSKALDKKDEALKEIQKEVKTAVNTYIKQIPKYDLFHYYRELVTKPEVFSEYASGMLSEEQIDFFCNYQFSLYAQRSYEVEDLAAMLYLQGKLFGIDKMLRVKNVVIDEAQDYSYFQLFALKSVLETDMFTIVGDLAQGIHSYRGINDWSIVYKEIFPRASYKTLQKSYRTTIEIMNAANEILKLLQLQLPTVEPVVRHSHKPLFIETSSDKTTIEKICSEIEKMYLDGLKTVAVIGKTNNECKKLVKLFGQYSKLPIQHLKENEEINKDKVVIVSSHLSKGLEFDVVIVCTMDEAFEANEIDIKLLYVSMTRPLHRLMLFGKNKSCFLLDKIEDSSLFGELVS